MTFKTVKEYYLNQWQSILLTNWKRISENCIALENSIAFPEGGGQLGDRGTIEQNGKKISFSTTQNDVGIGRVVTVKGFPTLNVEGEIQLHLAEELPDSFLEDKEIRVEIDTKYRAGLTRAHTAAHLVVMAFKKWFSDIEQTIRGCCIGDSGGRLDFAIRWPDPDFIQKIQLEFDCLVNANIPIVMTELGNEPECRIWNCDGVAIPCGGTHLSETGLVGKFNIRKKNKGKGLVRVYFEAVGPVADEICNKFEHNKEKKEIIAIVDAYGVGIHLPDAFKAKGFSSIHIHSLPFIPKVFKPAFCSEYFEEEIFFDGNIDCLCEKLQKMNIKAVLPGVEPGVELAGLLSERLNLRTNGSALGAARRDKYLMQETLRKNGLSNITQLKTNSVQNALAFAKSVGWPVVVKPLRSAGTDGVVLCRTNEDIRSAFRNHLGSINKFETRNDDLLCQEFICGNEYVVDTVSRDGRHLVVGIWKYEKMDGNNYNFVRSHMDLLPSCGSLSNELAEYTIKVLDALAIKNGASHSEVMLTAKGPVLIETAARTQGGIGSLLAGECVGFSQIEMIADVYTDGVKFSQNYGSNYALSKNCAVVFLNSRNEGVIRDMLSGKVISLLNSYKSHQLKFKKGDYLPKTVDVFTRGGWIALMHKDREIIKKDLQTIRDWEIRGRMYVTEPDSPCLQVKELMYGGVLASVTG